MFLFRVFCLVIFLAVLSNHAFAQTVDPSKTTVTGFANSTITGVPKFVIIHPMDKNGNQIADCSSPFIADFSVTMSGGGVTVPVTFYTCLQSTGQQNWQYIAKVATTYTITVTYQGIPVAQSPYHEYFGPGPLYVPNCYQKGLKKNTTVGVLTEFKIYTADIYNNIISTCPQSIKGFWNVSFSGPDGSNIIQNNYTCSAGVFSASFSLIYSGRYLLSISSGKENINNSPFNVNLRPTYISANHSYSYGPGYIAGTAGSNAQFFIVLEDIYGNRITTCPDISQFYLWSVKIIPYNAKQKTFYGYITDCSSGTLIAGYNTTIAGEYTISTYYNGVQLSYSESELIISADPNMVVQNSMAIGGGYHIGIAGAPTVFQVAPYDKYGNRIQECLSNVNYKDFQVTVSPDNGCSSGSTGCNDDLATYSMTYSCQKSMNYSLSVSYNGVPISNSPSNTFVTPSVISGPNSQFSGTGLHTAYAGVQAPIYISTYDQYGNKVFNCSAQSNTKFVVQAHLVGSQITVNGIVGNCIQGKGDFNAYYIIKQISTSPYTLSIDYGGNTLQTYSVITYPGPPVLSKCIVLGTKTVTAGDTAYVYIFCEDQFGNPIYQCDDSDVWSVILKGPSKYKADGAGCNNGNYTFTYSPEISGQYKSNITFIGSQGSYSGLIVQVNPAEFDPSNSLAQGDGVNPNVFLTVDNNATFSIISRDRFGNKVTNCVDLSTIAITISGPNSNIVYPSISNCTQGKGVIPVSYRPHISGTYSIDIRYNGSPISGSPYTAIWNAGSVDVGKCQVSGPGTTDNTAGEWADVYFHCSDQYNNPLTYCIGYGNWTITQRQSNPNFKYKIGGCNGGSYTGQWYAERAGIYNISVNYKGQQISGQSYGATLHPAGISSPNSRASGTGLTSTVQAGTTLTISINTFDRFSNKISVCYPSDSNSLVSPHQIVSPSILESSSFWNLTLTSNNQFYSQQSTSDCSNGVYTVTYSVTKVGTYKVILTGNDLKHPQGSPGSITITPGPLVPDTITANYPMANATAGKTYTLTIYGTDRYNNPVKTCSYTGSFTIYAIAASGRNYTGAIQGCDSGLYTATILIMEYDQTVPIYVLYSGTGVHNSPGYVVFGYGYFEGLNSYAIGNGVNSSYRLIAGDNHDLQVVLVNQYNVTIHSAGLCQQVATYNWTVMLTSISTKNFTLYFFDNVQCSDNDQNIMLWYNKTVADDYLVSIWYIGTTHRIPIDYPVTIYPDELITNTAKISNVTQDVETAGAFNLVGFDKWGNLADFTGHLSEWQIYLSPQCIFNYPIQCTAEKSNTSRVVTHATCNYNVSYGGVYCLIVTYQGYSLPHIPVTKLLVAGGYQCNPTCQNGGFCIPTTVNNNNNNNKNHSSNSTTNGTGLAAGQCHCQNEYTGDQCQTKISKSYMGLGLAIGLIIGLAILLFIIGLIIGFFVSRRQHQHHHEGLIE